MGICQQSQNIVPPINKTPVQITDEMKLEKQAQQQNRISSQNDLNSQKPQNPQKSNLSQDLQLSVQRQYELIKEKNQKVECGICMESSSIEELKILGCCHIFHFECLNQSCLTQMKGRTLPSCPQMGCQVPIDESDLTLLLDGIQMHEYQQLFIRKFQENHNDEFSCCPTPDCSYIFILGDNSYFECPLCDKIYCFRCKVEYHLGYTCSEYVYEIRNNKDMVIDDQFLTFAHQSKFKQCPQCKFWVEKNEGCNHMVCRCRFEFCYACGGIYRSCRCCS